MGLDALFGKSYAILERAMDLRSAHHNRLVSNTVNMDTPGYRAFDTMIDDQLARLDPGSPPATMQRTHLAHFDGAAPAAAVTNADQRTAGEPLYGRRVDRNTVDLERNMAELQENQLVYTTLAQIVSRKFRGLKDAIRGGQ